MAPIRFRIRTIMIALAALAVVMGLLRLMLRNHPFFNFLLGLIVQITSFSVYDWFLQKESDSSRKFDRPIGNPERN